MSKFPQARSYQLDLVEVAANNNVIISLATGAGKTLIAADVIRRKLPTIKQNKQTVMFLAPTNPLVAQQCEEALIKTYGFKARAFHGNASNRHLPSWSRDKWDDVISENDVLVMTPDVLLHVVSHGVLKMSDIGLIIFDEAHHCKSDHPYNQLLQDFYHVMDAAARPQILGLTASPDGVEPDSRRRKGRPFNPGLQHNMNAFLITVPAEGPLRHELSSAVPRPSTHFLSYQAVPAEGVIADSLMWLNWMKQQLLRPAKRCEQLCSALRRQELLAAAGHVMDESLDVQMFEGFTEGGRISALDKQIRGVLYCLENLGPWCAAAAAYLDLLAPPEQQQELEDELQEIKLDQPPDWSDDDDDNEDHDDQDQDLGDQQGSRSRSDQDQGSDPDQRLSDDHDNGNDYYFNSLTASGSPSLKHVGHIDSCRVHDDELRGSPQQMITELRLLLNGIVEFLRLHAEQSDLSMIITQQQLQEALTTQEKDMAAAAAAAAAANGGSSIAGSVNQDTNGTAAVQGPSNGANESAAAAAAAAGSSGSSNPAGVECCARGILRLTCRVALLITMNVLADMLVDDKELKQQLMREAGGASGCCGVDSRSSGGLQGFAEVLLRRVPFSLLEAQIWPELYTTKPPPPWQGPLLLTHKVVTLVRLLETDRQRCLQQQQQQQPAAPAGGQDAAAGSSSEDWWSSMVFVETKLSALVLSKLLSTLPIMRSKLRSGYLLGDTKGDGTARGLAMNNKQQAQVVAGFRTSAINVLIATSVGSEGLDFKQCQLVVAFDLPRDVTCYIQCRGRGRKAGSRYCFMQQEETKDNINGIIRRAERLEARVIEISTENRKLLSEHAAATAAAAAAAATGAAGAGSSTTTVIPRLELRCDPEPSDPVTRLVTHQGAVVTLRLAQKLLAEYCAKLPGSDRSTLLQPHYSTRMSAGLFHTTVYLPSNTGIQSVVDTAAAALSSKQSRQQAALQVLRLLYLGGKLNDQLQPVWITQRLSKQLEAEPIPHLTYEIRIRQPLQPRLMPAAPDTAAAVVGKETPQPDCQDLQQQQQQPEQQQVGTTITFHLYTFIYGPPAAGTPQQQQQGPAAAAAVLAEQQRIAESSLLAAAVGSDAAVSALPGGPSVVSGMSVITGMLHFGVLLCDKLPNNLMTWPVWIDRQLYVMDVCYIGPQQLGQREVDQLLGYQHAVNKHINWDKTRAEWLKQAREAEAAAAESEAEAAMEVDTATTTAATAEQQNTTTAAAAAASDEQQQQQEQGSEQQQEQPAEAPKRQPVLPFSPQLLRNLMQWEKGAPPPQQQQQQGLAAAAAATSDCNGDTHSPSVQISYLIVPIKNNSNNSTCTAPGGRNCAASSKRAAAAAAECSAAVPASTAAAPVKLVSGYSGLDDSSSTLLPETNLAGAAAAAGSSATHPAAAAARSSSSRQHQQQQHINVSDLIIDWSRVNHMASGLLPLSHLISHKLGLKKFPEVPAERIELPPPVPPEPESAALVAAAAAAGKPVPLKGAAAMAAVHPGVTPSQVLGLDQELKGRVIVSGHNSHVYTVLGVANHLTPATDITTGIMQSNRQTGITNGGVSHQGVGDAVDLAAAAAGVVHTTANSASILSPVVSANTPNRITPASATSHDDVIMTNQHHHCSGLLTTSNLNLAAAVMLSSSMMDHDPEQRPMLGWKVGKTDDGLPIWDYVIRHDDYYRVRCGVTGLRSDLPMIAVKSSRCVTDCCLLPPREQQQVIEMPTAAAAASTGGEQQQQQQVSIRATAAAAEAPHGETDAALLDLDDGVPSADVTAAAAGGAVGSSNPRKRTAASSSGLTAAAAATDSDKCRRVLLASDVSAAANKANRLEQFEQQQFAATDPLLLLPTPEQFSAASSSIATMSRSARRKVMANHRVMFLPVELVWLLPITSSDWSHLQLIPNIIYRLDSILGATSMHDQLHALLHGDGAAAAAEVHNAPAGPNAEDELAAATQGWQQPAVMHDLMAGISHRELLSQPDQDQPGGPDSQAGNSDGGPDSQAGLLTELEPDSQPTEADLSTAAAAVVTAVEGSTYHQQVIRAEPQENAHKSAGDRSAAAGAAANAVNGSSSSSLSGSWREVPLPSPTLLLVSLTASSCHEAFDLERLEFLGDVILKVLSTHCLMKAFPPDANESELSVAKARIIRNLRLAQLGRSAPLFLQYQLRSHPHDSHLWTPTGTDAALGLFEDGRTVTSKGKRIADGVESLIGAFYFAGAAKEAAMKAVAAADLATADMAAAAAADGSAGDVTSWVWTRVSRGGLVAAAAFCEAVGVLPAGSAKYLTGAPMSLPPVDSTARPLLSLLHPSYRNHISGNASSTNSNGTTTASAAGSSGGEDSALADKFVSRLRKLPGGALPYKFSDPRWLVQSLTHVSVLGSSSYQRLEFLGDALMDLLVSLRTLAAGRRQHLDPGTLTKTRAKVVSNNMMAAAAVMSGLHLMLHANSWRLLLAVHAFARDVKQQRQLAEKQESELDGSGDRTLNSAITDKPSSKEAAGEQQSGPAAAAAIRLAANAGVLSRAAAAAESAGATRQSVLAAAAAAATKALAAAAAGALGSGTAAFASKLAQEVLDDDTLWMAVWLRKKELVALQAAAARAAKAAAAAAAANEPQDTAAATAAAAAGTTTDIDSNPSTDVTMSEAVARSSEDIAKELQQQVVAAAAPAAGDDGVEKAPRKKFPKVCADLIESVTAAVYVDSGGDWESTWRVGEFLLCRHWETLERLQQQQQQQVEGVAQVDEGDDDAEQGVEDDLLGF